MTSSDGSATSRRRFLTSAGAAGAVAAAAVVLPGSSAEAASAAAPRHLPTGVTSVLAHIKDVRSGQIAVMVAGHEVVVTDHALTAKLAHLVAPASL